MNNDRKAQEISVDVLNRSGTSLMDGDFDAFSVCFHTPSYVETFEGMRLLRTQADLRNVYDNVRKYYQDAGVTKIIRECISARFEDENTISNMHITRLYRDTGTLDRRPFPVSSTLVRVGAMWKVNRAQYAIDDAPHHNQALSG